MGDSGTDGPWSDQTVGERIVAAAWRAVAAHLERQRVAVGDAPDPADSPAAGPPRPVGHDRLR